MREWCLGPESNRHAAKRQILSLLCLPVPPPRHARKVRIIDDGWRENEFFVQADPTVLRKMRPASGLPG